MQLLASYRYDEYDCHAYKFGKFCSLVSMADHDLHEEHDNARILHNFKKAYHAALEWNKVVNLQDKKVKYISTGDMDEELPDCVVHFYNNQQA